MVLLKKQEQQLKIFQKELLKQNQSINLFSRKKPEQQLKLLFDQAFLAGESLFTVFHQTSSPILDIGSGNGFPGLFMGILYPKQTFYLCDRSRKKTEFLKYVLSQTGLSNVKVFCKSAEEMQKAFSLILSQAALPTAKMLKLLEKLLASDGQAFLWKNSYWRKGWPENSGFLSEVFKQYKSGPLDQVLLKVTKNGN